MPDRPDWGWKQALGPGGELALLPVPLEIPIGRLSRRQRWRVALANGLYVENAPPWRLIMLGERTVAHYPIDDPVQERLALVHLVAQGWMPATAWAAAFGLHRNSLGNWTWRYRCFGLEGLRDDVLPRREHLRPVLAAARELVQAQGGRVTPPRLREELERRGLAELSPEALRWLLLSVSAEAAARAGRPQAPSVDLDSLADSGDPDQSECTPGAADGGRSDPRPDHAAPEPEGDGRDGSASAEPDAGGDPGQDAAPVDPDAAWRAAESSALSPGQAGAAPPELDGSGDAPPVQPDSGEDQPQQSAAADPDAPWLAAESSSLSPGQAGAALDGSGDAPPAQPDSDEDRPRQTAPAARTPPRAMRFAGLALVLPLVQSLLDPLQPFLQQAWGGRRWLYTPQTLLTAFIFYLLLGFKNPEQVKASPHRDFGPLLGRRRGPACVTLRRRLVPMARVPQLVEAFQRELALVYLSLGWVEPGQWSVDGHFLPYFGKHAWGKGWWPQRRVAVRGAVQDWVADRRGRPLWLHLTQGFELFADQLPLIAQGLHSLLTDAGAADCIVLVFDRGGYGSAVFTALNRLGVGWVTWIKAKLHSPPSAFTEQGVLPPSPRRPALPGRTVYYTRTTYAPAGLPGVPAVVWHDGDPTKQVGLISNLEARFPGRFSALDQIRMLRSRWAEENAFKDMVHHDDLDSSNGYAHEPSAATPVPNPERRRLQAKQLQRTGQLRRAMNRLAAARTPRSATRNRRRVGTLKGQLTRLENGLANLPPTVPYGELGRPATEQLQPGRGTLVPVLRAATYHIRLQLRDAVAAVFPDHREWDKVIRTIVHTPGRYVPGADADRIILEPCGQPRYIRALELLVARTNAGSPHAPGRPDHPLRFELSFSQSAPAPVHNAPARPPAK